MAIKQIMLTPEGLAALENELEDLKSVKRKEIAEKIKVALSFGDLSENSEYDEAKNEQAICEARIADIEVMLKNVKIIDTDELSDENIHIGSLVAVMVTMPNGTKTEREYRIVGSNEADPAEGKISDESAVGKALLGHTLGEKLEVEVPAGTMVYESPDKNARGGTGTGDACAVPLLFCRARLCSDALAAALAAGPAHYNLESRENQ